MKSSEIPRKKDVSFTCSTLDGDLMLLNTTTTHFHGLCNVALAVWEAIDGERDLGTIQAMIASRYDVDRDTCFAEVAAFVDELRHEGIVDAG